MSLDSEALDGTVDAAGSEGDTSQSSDAIVAAQLIPRRTSTLDGFNSPTSANTREPEAAQSPPSDDHAEEEPPKPLTISEKLWLQARQRKAALAGEAGASTPEIRTRADTDSDEEDLIDPDTAMAAALAKVRNARERALRDASLRASKELSTDSASLRRSTRESKPVQSVKPLTARSANAKRARADDKDPLSLASLAKEARRNRSRYDLEESLALMRQELPELPQSSPEKPPETRLSREAEGATTAVTETGRKLLEAIHRDAAEIDEDNDEEERQGAVDIAGIVSSRTGFETERDLVPPPEQRRFWIRPPEIGERIMMQPYAGKERQLEVLDKLFTDRLEISELAVSTTLWSLSLLGSRRDNMLAEKWLWRVALDPYVAAETPNKSRIAANALCAMLRSTRYEEPKDIERWHIRFLAAFDRLGGYIELPESPRTSSKLPCKSISVEQAVSRCDSLATVLDIMLAFLADPKQRLTVKLFVVLVRVMLDPTSLSLTFQLKECLAACALDAGSSEIWILYDALKNECSARPRSHWLAMLKVLPHRTTAQRHLRRRLAHDLLLSSPADAPRADLLGLQVVDLEQLSGLMTGESAKALREMNDVDLRATIDILFTATSGLDELMRTKTTNSAQLKRALARCINSLRSFDTSLRSDVRQTSPLRASAKNTVDRLAMLFKYHEKTFWGTSQTLLTFSNQ